MIPELGVYHCTLHGKYFLILIDADGAAGTLMTGQHCCGRPMTLICKWEIPPKGALREACLAFWQAFEAGRL